MSAPPQLSITDAVDECVGDLHGVWNEIGLDQGIRETHLADLTQHIMEFLNERVRQERNVRDLTRRSIQTHASKIVLICKQLGIDESKAHEFIADHTGPQSTLFQSRDALSRHLEELTSERRLSIDELTSVLTSLFAMEADLGESTGSLELFCELQTESFDETQANTFRNDPTALDEDTLKAIPETLERMREKLVDVKAVVESRQQQLDVLDASIDALCQDVGEAKDAYRNSSLSQHPPWSLRRIEAVKMIENQLIALRERRGVVLHDLANKIRVVWGQLEVDKEHRENFIAKNNGRSMEVIRACEEELARVQVLKQARIHELILKLRDRIRAAWKGLSTPDFEQKLFEDRYDYVAEATFSDETLDAHKVMANSLEEMVQASEPIRIKIKEHQQLMEDKLTYDELTRDGARLRDRKYNMMAEEKLRKRVARLPSLSEALYVELMRWKNHYHNQPLRFEGRDYLQVVRDMVDEEKLNRVVTRPTSSGNLGVHSATNSASTSNGASMVSMTPSKPRSASQSRVNAPATTGKPVTSRARTNTAEGSKAIASSSHASSIRENALNK